MLSRRYLLSIVTLSVLAACTDGVAPRLSQERTQPYLVQWAPSLQPQFSTVGATSIAPGLPILSSSVGGPTAQVVIDHSSSATTSATSLTWSHMVGADSNRLLVVGVSIRNANNHVSSVSYAGVPLAFYGARNNSDNAVRAELWYVAAPPTGSGNVTVRLSGGAKMVAGAVSFSGVDPVSPLRGLASAGSTDKGTTNPQVADSSDVNELVLSVLATEGCAGSLTPASGQTQQWNRFYGTSGGDVAGVASTAPGASTLVMSWTKAKDAKWAIATAVIKPYVGLSLTAYQASFWAVRGQSRSLQINYQRQGGDTQPFLQLTTSDPTYVPGLGTLAVGDSVLVTVTVDPNNIAVSLEPAGMLFGTPTQLQIWYGGAGADLNRDGVVNAEDSTIESQLLGIWYQEQATDPWEQIQATQSLLEKAFTAALPHFSRYAVAW